MLNEEDGNGTNDCELEPKVKIPALKDGLSCTRCGEKQGTYSEITYSQGDRVCYPCAEKTKEADKRAFDRDMSFRV